jgi:hypothetical protein
MTTTSAYSLFLAECFAAADPTRGPTDDEMYGVYTSWCLLRQQRLASPPVFWTAMRELGIPDPCRVATRMVRPGLQMQGPAAVDYIVTSRPSLF